MRSGVQVYGRSASDLLTPNPNLSSATGLALASGGSAELRVRKDDNGSISMTAMVLRDLGISWNGSLERPIIVETMQPTAGRVQLDGAGALLVGGLPPSSNLDFYDFATRSAAATQSDYANNHYFPRVTPSRCPPGYTPCPTVETSGPQVFVGDWRTGGVVPDASHTLRFHEDGDVHAGDGLPDANGNPTVLPGGSGFGVPYPGSKGFRHLVNWNYRYANLGTWTTEDTVQIFEWGASDEHNQNRRGVIAYGDVTNPLTIPPAGTARYSGIAYGYYSSDGSGGPTSFQGTAVVVVDFVSRAITVTLQDTVIEWTTTPVPLTLNASTVFAAPSSSEANYFSGPANNASLNGGFSGRFFGPIVAGGVGSGPAEIAGVLSLSNETTKAAAVAGFIAREQ